MLTRGQQIVYIPNHISFSPGEPLPLDEPGVEKGFVTSVNGDFAFCRYWRNNPPFGLRTKANSELTPIANLVIQDTVPQIAVEAALERFCTKYHNS
jgi:hypothetical protein